MPLKFKMVIKLLCYLLAAFLLFALVWWLGPEIKVGDSRPLEPVGWRIFVLSLIFLALFHTRLIQLLHFAKHSNVFAPEVYKSDEAHSCDALLRELRMASRPLEMGTRRFFWYLKWIIYTPDFLICGQSDEVGRLLEHWPHLIEWDSGANSVGRGFISNGKSWLVMDSTAWLRWAVLLKWRVPAQGMVWVVDGRILDDQNSKNTLQEALKSHFYQWSQLNKRLISMWLLVVDLKKSSTQIPWSDLDSALPYGFCLPYKKGLPAFSYWNRQVGRFLEALYKSCLSNTLSSEAVRTRFKLFSLCATQLRALHTLLNDACGYRSLRPSAYIGGIFWVWVQSEGGSIGLSGFIQAICRQRLVSPLLKQWAFIRNLIAGTMVLLALIWFTDATYLRINRHLKAQQYWRERNVSLSQERLALDSRLNASLQPMLAHLRSLDELILHSEDLLKEPLNIAAKEAIRKAYSQIVVEYLVPALQAQNTLCVKKFPSPSGERLYRALAFSQMIDRPKQADLTLMRDALVDCSLHSDDVNEAINAWQRADIDANTAPAQQTVAWRKTLLEANRYTIDQHIWISTLRHQYISDPSNFSLWNAIGVEEVWFKNASSVPWIFTAEGLRLGFQNANQYYAKWGGEYFWIMGQPAVDLDSTHIDALNNLIKARYINNAIKEWDSWFSDLKLQPANSLVEEIVRAQHFAAENSPLVKLMLALQENMPLPEEQNNSLWKRIAFRIQSDWDRFRHLFGWRASPRATAMLDSPEIVIGRHFELLRRYFQDVNGKSVNLDRLRQEIQRLAQQLSQQDAAIVGNNKISMEEIIEEFLYKATLLPSPLNNILAGFSVEGERQVAEKRGRALGSTLADIATYNKCKYSSLPYPLDLSANNELRWMDFVDDFSAQGKIQRYIAEQGSILNTKTSPWSLSFKNTSNEKVINREALWLERAWTISRAWFLANNQGVDFYIKAIHLDPNIKQVRININEQLWTYAHGQTFEKKIHWDGQGANLSIQMDLVGIDGKVMKYRANGPWAILRWAQSAKQNVSAEPSRMSLTFQMPEGNATIEIRVEGPLNPLNLELYENFCSNLS